MTHTYKDMPRPSPRLIPRCLILAAGVLLCAALFGAGAAAGRTVPVVSRSTSSVAFRGGVNIDPLNGKSLDAGIDSAVTTASTLHAKLVRTGVLWALLEPNRSAKVNTAALASVDRLVADARAGGMEVVLTVDTTPCWASSAPARLLRKCVPGRVSAANAWPPTKASYFAAFAAYLAHHFSSGVAALEIWNEPDQSNEAYFAGPEKAVRYAGIVKASYPAIKRANPNMLVLAGAIVGSNGDFLRALYAAGMKGSYDGLAVHYYTLTLASVHAIHQVQVENGDSTPLWLDEFGWTSCWPRSRTQQEQGCVTRSTQARNLLDTLRSLAQLRYVAAALVYKLEDSPSEEFGLLTARGARKPAFSAVASALAAPNGPVSPVTVSVRVARGQVLVSGSGPVGDFMVLEGYRGSTLRLRDLFTLNRFNEYAIRLPQVLGTSNLHFRVYTYGAGPGTAAQASI